MQEVKTEKSAGKNRGFGSVRFFEKTAVFGSVRFIVTTLIRKLFDTVQMRDLIDFIKDIGLYQKI